MRRSLLLGAVFAGWVAAPTTAAAHLASSGLGPFYDGALHVVMSPDDLLGLIAAALLAGLCGARAGRLTVFVLPGGWLLAGLAALNLAPNVEGTALSVASLIVLGAVVALAPRIPAWAVACFGGVYGALHGFLNGSALAAVGAGPVTLGGIAVTAFVVALLVSAAVVSLRAAWTRIAVRVLGSWVAAVGMLMLGWLVSGAG